MTLTAPLLAFTRIPSSGFSTPPVSTRSPPDKPRVTSRNSPLTGPASTSRAASRPSRTSHTTLLPPASCTAEAGSRNREAGAPEAGADALPESLARKSTRAPISGRIRGSWSRMLTFTCTVARCRSAVGTTWRTSPRNDVSG